VLSRRSDHDISEAARPPRRSSERKAETGQPFANSKSSVGEDNTGLLKEQTVWVLNANKLLMPREVSTGRTNGHVTALGGGDLQEGDVVVIGQA